MRATSSYVAQPDELHHPNNIVPVAQTEAQSELASGARVWIKSGRTYHEAVVADWRDAGHTVRGDRESPSQILLFFPKVQARLLYEVQWLSHGSTCRMMYAYVPHRFILSVQGSFKGASH
jgi:hypothetical protein